MRSRLVALAPIVAGVHDGVLPAVAAVVAMLVLRFGLAGAVRPRVA